MVGQVGAVDARLLAEVVLDVEPWFGESVCEPTMRKPVLSSTVSGTSQATTAPSRTMNWPPRARSHGWDSSRRVNPAASSWLATSSAAWYELGEAWMKRLKSSM